VYQTAEVPRVAAEPDTNRQLQEEVGGRNAPSACSELASDDRATEGSHGYGMGRIATTGYEKALFNRQH